MDWLPPFGGVVCWDAKRGETKKGGLYEELWVPVEEGRERQLALARAWKLRRTGGYRPGGFHIGSLKIKGWEKNEEVRKTGIRQRSASKEKVTVFRISKTGMPRSPIPDTGSLWGKQKTRFGRKVLH